MAITLNVRLTEIECTCGTLFAISEQYETELRRTHATFYCPRGHHLSYRGKTEEEKLREQLGAARELAEREATRRRQADQRAEHEERSARAYRGHVTRLKRRLGAGKCPCCSETFPDVAEHLAAEHPGYTDVDEHAESTAPA